MKFFAGIRKNVFLLGFLSLANDLTADMITPLLPAYLATLGMGPAFLGLMEGLANALARITMLFSGVHADKKGKLKSTTLFGYSLSSFSRLFLAIPLAGVVLAARLADRLGKGIRTSPRDNLITASTDEKHWGKAFGLHSAMDHAGAFLAPTIAAWAIAHYELPLGRLFLYAAIPCIVALLFVGPILEDKPIPAGTAPKPRLSWKDLSPALKRYMVLIFASALSTPSELFIIMKVNALGAQTYQLPLAWLTIYLSALVGAFIGGALSDSWGRRRSIALGWIVFGFVYLGFAFTHSLTQAWFLMAIFGLQTGFTEPAEKAYPAHLSAEGHRGTSIGWFHFSYGMGLLPASFCFGLVWKYAGDNIAFLGIAILTFVTTWFIQYLPSDRKKPA